MVCDLTDMNHRTNLAIKNIGISSFLKGGSILTTIVLVPLTLDYLNNYEYGIWLTLNSVLSWVVVAAVLLVALSPWVLKLWVGDKIQVPFSLSVLCASYFLIYTYGSIYVNIVNGIGKLKMQMIFSVVEAVVFVPLTILCARKFGIDGVMVATIVVTVPTLLWAPYQSLKLLNGTAKGIWNQ